MARLARVVVPGIPHHVTQRGNRRQPVFFHDSDRQLYLRILKEQAQQHGLEIWAYCLMDNHVHLVVVPKTKESLMRGIGETHRRYTRYINLREKWRGYLWQGRFSSFPMDEKHLYAAIRYVERNPVSAGMVEYAEDYPWSSARAHVKGVKDAILSMSFLSREISDWRSFLMEPEGQEMSEDFERHSRTGRPYGGEEFLSRLEQQSGRFLGKQKAGRKKKGMEKREIGIVSPE